jgi:hypothetical protein
MSTDRGSVRARTQWTQCTRARVVNTRNGDAVGIRLDLFRRRTHAVAAMNHCNRHMRTSRAASYRQPRRHAAYAAVISAVSQIALFGGLLLCCCVLQECARSSNQGVTTSPSQDLSRMESSFMSNRISSIGRH